MEIKIDRNEYSRIANIYPANRYSPAIMVYQEIDVKTLKISKPATWYSFLPNGVEPREIMLCLQAAIDKDVEWSRDTGLEKFPE